MARLFSMIILILLVASKCCVRSDGRKATKEERETARMIASSLPRGQYPPSAPRDRGHRKFSNITGEPFFLHRAGNHRFLLSVPSPGQAHQL
ncbi:hypothetical protein Nepgr_026106 [Nepenthes gracilis]|uniref:Secreted protein n=1 Tax=Nepenthes gracilis TaxID=150966 RepID=A0AAD3T7F3_NEPGR|nr:hypothetical protein Nepgr_026106 [Nepenthes gracilis]